MDSFYKWCTAAAASDLGQRRRISPPEAATAVGYDHNISSLSATDERASAAAVVAISFSAAVTRWPMVCAVPSTGWGGLSVQAAPGVRDAHAAPGDRPLVGEVTAERQAQSLPLARCADAGDQPGSSAESPKRLSLAIRGPGERHRSATGALVTPRSRGVMAEASRVRGDGRRLPRALGRSALGSRLPRSGWSELSLAEARPSKKTSCRGVHCLRTSDKNLAPLPLSAAKRAVI